MKPLPRVRRTGSRPLTLSLVLRRVIREGRLTRSRIAEMTGFTVGAVSRITRDLIDAALLKEAGSYAEAGKVGPRFIELEPRRGGGFVIGIGIEASAQHVQMLDIAGAEVSRKTFQVTHLADPASTIRRLVHEVERMIERSGVDRSRIFGVGVAAIGVVDPVEGVVLNSRTTGWEKVAIGGRMASALALPVTVDSWLNAINLGEHRFGQARQMQNVALVHTTLGIGASLIANGHVVRGAGMLAGQIAHARVPNGKVMCVCGRRGCLTTVASGRAVLQAVEESLPYQHDGTENYNREVVLLANLLERARNPQTKAARAVAGAGRALGRFLAGIAALSNPETILLGGILGEHPLYVGGVREGLHAFQPLGRESALRTTRMGGEYAGALLALEELVCNRPLRLEGRVPVRARQGRKQPARAP